MTSEYPGAPARLAASRRSARNPNRPPSGLPTHLSSELFARAKVVRLPAGRVLFREGDPGLIVTRQHIAQRALAAMVGAGREYVARTLEDWRRRKLVSRRPSGCYCVENKALLKLEVKYR